MTSVEWPSSESTSKEPYDTEAVAMPERFAQCFPVPVKSSRGVQRYFAQNSSNA